MQVSIETAIGAKGDKIDVLIPATQIKAWLTSLAEQPFAFEFGPIEAGYNITIKQADLTNFCEFVGFYGKDFPVIETSKGETANIQFENITEALARTAYSKLNDSTGNMLNNICLELGETATFVSFNGVVCSLFKFDGKFAKMDLILPDAIVQVLSGMQLTGECIMTYSPKNIAFSIGGITIKSILSDGAYIAYKHGLIIPPNNVTCNRSEVMAAIKRTLIFSDKITTQIRLQFSQLGILVSGSDDNLKNKAQERVKCECPADLIIGFNGNMTYEALNHMPSDEIVLSYSSWSKAMFIHASLTDESFCMVAPMMLKENL